MTLDELEIGERGIVVQIYGKGMLRRRLLDMGITPRTIIEVRKKAPMGDPIEYKLRGYVLTLRKDEAARIEIVKEDDDGSHSLSGQSELRKDYTLQRNHRQQSACGQFPRCHGRKKGRHCNARPFPGIR